MKIRSIRRLTNDSHHNAFTGACWFKGALYVAFRQGDSHAEPQGRLIVLRSRDEGASFDIVHVARGKGDTRDAHLYTDGRRLRLVGFVTDASSDRCSGTSWTADGLQWSRWTPFKGAAGYVMWRPRFFAGSHYCAGYRCDGSYGVDWFESRDGVSWKKVLTLRPAGPEKPNECAFDFKPDGEVALLMRREASHHRPLLLRSKPPYTRWISTELDLSLSGPALWWAGDELWIAGRWRASPGVAHAGVFQVVADKPVFKMVLPSGPEFDCSYIGVAPHPVQKGRFFFSYYSNHVAPSDPAVSQWQHPDIYLADALFSASYIRDWKVSDVKPLGLQDAAYPADPQLEGWHALQALPPDAIAAGFVSAKPVIRKQPGVLTFVADLEVGPSDSGLVFLGYDGPVRAWLNGTEIFSGPGTNPAVPDKTAVPVRFRHGRNRLAIALDTNQGRACGLFARYQAD